MELVDFDNESLGKQVKAIMSQIKSEKPQEVKEVTAAACVLASHMCAHNSTLGSVDLKALHDKEGKNWGDYIITITKVDDDIYPDAPSYEALTEEAAATLNNRQLKRLGYLLAAMSVTTTASEPPPLVEPYYKELYRKSQIVLFEEIQKKLLKKARVPLIPSSFEHAVDLIIQKPGGKT